MALFENNFKTHHILPQNLIIDSSGTHLYRIGLSLYKNGSKKRNKYHYPLVFTIANLFTLFRCLTAMHIKDGNLQLIIGDVFNFIDMKIHGNTVMSCIAILSLISQAIHYYKYKNNIKPSFLKPFEMMSGLISP